MQRKIEGFGQGGERGISGSRENNKGKCDRRTHFNAHAFHHKLGSDFCTSPRSPSSARSLSASFDKIVTKSKENIKKGVNRSISACGTRASLHLSKLLTCRQPDNQHHLVILSQRTRRSSQFLQRGGRSRHGTLENE
jgi:hypothetical protein